MNELQPITTLKLENEVERFIAFIDRKPQTAVSYLNSLRQFESWRRYMGIALPERADLIAYKTWLLSEHDGVILDNNNTDGWAYRLQDGKRVRLVCKPATVNSYLQATTAFFKWLASENRYPDITIGLHSPKAGSEHKKDALSVDNIARIRTTIASDAQAKITISQQSKKDTAGRVARATEQAARLTAMLELASTAGLRCCELSRANIGDLELVDGIPFLSVYGKGHDSADVRKALAMGTYQVIKDYLAVRKDSLAPSSPLFLATGNRNTTGRISPSTIGAMLKASMRSAGFDSGRLTPHSLRHTTACETLAITGDLYATQKYMRHQSPLTTEVYLHANEKKAEAATANQVYNRLHGISEDMQAKEKLANLISKLSDEQIRKLVDYAELLAG